MRSIGNYKTHFYIMGKLETSFAGLKLQNPIIVSSSGLTDTASKCRSLEEAGAGAVVLKSIFEEQIMQQYDRWYNPNNNEGNDYLNTYLHSYSLNKHILLIQEAKRICTIPIIASINCTGMDEWISYAKIIEDAGADAIELNIMEVQTDKEYEYGSYEQKHINILKNVKKHTSLPIIIKLGMNLTSPIALINQLYANGVNAVVLFNHPYRPDINIDKSSLTVGEMWSHASDICNALRWTCIGSAEIPLIDYGISGGVHDGWAVIKSLLAGASAVEICTTIFWNGSQRIQTMKKQIEEWMNEREYKNIQQFKGKINTSFQGKNMFERTQFMKYYSTYNQNRI